MGDFERYRRAVRPGGLIAFHDIVPHAEAARCDVADVWHEIKQNYAHLRLRTLEIIDSADTSKIAGGPWGGIGVVRLPA